MTVKESRKVLDEGALRISWRKVIVYCSDTVALGSNHIVQRHAFEMCYMKRIIVLESRRH